MQRNVVGIEKHCQYFGEDMKYHSRVHKKYTNMCCPLPRTAYCHYEAQLPNTQWPLFKMKCRSGYENLQCCLSTHSPICWPFCAWNQHIPGAHGQYYRCWSDVIPYPPNIKWRLNHSTHSRPWIVYVFSWEKRLWLGIISKLQAGLLMSRQSPWRQEKISGIWSWWMLTR